MEKYVLILIVFMTIARAAANDFPNSSFEYDAPPVWNRMPDRSPTDIVKTWKIDSSDAFDGKQSLLLEGQKAEFDFETPLTYRKPNVLSLYLKAEKVTSVKVELRYYIRTNQTDTVKRTFKVGTKWKRYNINIVKPFKNIRRSGSILGPLRLTIDPGKEKLRVDGIQFESGKKPKPFRPGPKTGVPAGKMPIPVGFVPLAPENIKMKSGSGKWAFRLFPGGAGAEKSAALSGVMLFPPGKAGWKNTRYSLWNGSRKIPAAFTPIAVWPGDGSVSALLTEFNSDIPSQGATLRLQAEPGTPEPGTPFLRKHGTQIETGNSKDKFIIDCNASALWKSGGPRIGPCRLTGRDLAGNLYTFVPELTRIERNTSFGGTVVRRGKLTSRDGMALAAAIVRLHFRKDRPGVRLEISVSNTSDQVVPIREIHWECNTPGSSGMGKRILLTAENNKKKFLMQNQEHGKISEKRSSAPLPLRIKSGSVYVHAVNAAEYFPGELSTTGKAICGALWPESCKILSFWPGLTLMRDFFISPEPLPAAASIDCPATVQPSGKTFADSRAMIRIGAADHGKLPFFESRMSATSSLGRFQPKNLRNKFLFGQFDFGDHLGDGGWANLESFEDYVLFHRAMRQESPELFRLARAASRHYRDIDTDRRSGLAHIHSANHVIGGCGFGHAWIQGVLSDYLLTGELSSGETAHRLITACAQLPEGNGAIQVGRNFGFYLLTLTEGYALFNDPALKKRFFRQLNYQIQRYAKNPPSNRELLMQRTSVPRQNSLFFVPSSGLVPFHCWYGLTALLKMRKISGDVKLDPIIRREFGNIMNLEMTYRPQLETHWPGLPAKKMFPAIATDYLLGRGAFYYPVLTMYAELTGEKKYLQLALDTAYAGLLANRTSGNIQDVFMAAPFADLPKDFNEATQLEKIRSLLWNGAASSLRNGSFDHSLPYRDLVIPKNGIGKPRYPEWAVNKPYPRNWHFAEGKQIISSMFMRFRPEYYDLVHDDFGAAPPALRLNFDRKKWFLKLCSLTGAKFRMNPGEWEYSVLLKPSPGIGTTQIGLRITRFDGTGKRLGVKLQNGRIKPDSPVESIRWLDSGKPGWKRLTFRFRISQKSLGIPRIRVRLAPKAGSASLLVDDISIRRISSAK